MSFRIVNGKAICLTCREAIENKASVKVRHKCPRRTPDWLAKARARQQAPAPPPRPEGGACRDQEQLFEDADPHGSGRTSAAGRLAIAEARAVCRTCPIREECLTDTLAAEAGHDGRDRYSVAGGLTGDERYQIYRRGAEERTA